MPKITVEPFGRQMDDYWQAYLGDELVAGQDIGIGDTPNAALGSLVAGQYKELGIDFLGEKPSPGEITGALGGIVRAFAKKLDIEVEIKELGEAG